MSFVIILYSKYTLFNVTIILRPFMLIIILEYTFNICHVAYHMYLLFYNLHTYIQVEQVYLLTYVSTHLVQPINLGRQGLATKRGKQDLITHLGEQVLNPKPYLDRVINIFIFIVGQVYDQVIPNESYDTKRPQPFFI